MTILCIDGLNFAHRARAGFAEGEHAVIFNFFRNLRSIVDRFKPTRIYYVTDGIPVKRRAMFKEYKANRKIPQEDVERRKMMHHFYDQVGAINKLMAESFPISVIGHADHEADDIIYNLIKRGSRAIDWVVMSTDTDFIQLLGEFSNVKLYNPVTKRYIENPPYDYVMWKALRGDGSDNIDGFKGIGNVRAAGLIEDTHKLKAFLLEEPNREKHWLRNIELIRFIELSHQEVSEMKCSQPTRDWNHVKEQFKHWKFQSLLKPTTWEMFINTFDYLWGRT